MLEDLWSPKEAQKDEFYDLFSSAESLFQVKTVAKIRYKYEGLEVFNKLREQRWQTLPLNLLATTLAIQSSEPKQQKIPAMEKIPEKGKEKEQEKEKAWSIFPFTCTNRYS